MAAQFVNLAGQYDVIHYRLAEAAHFHVAADLLHLCDWVENLAYILWRNITQQYHFVVKPEAC